MSTYEAVREIIEASNNLNATKSMKKVKGTQMSCSRHSDRPCKTSGGFHVYMKAFRRRKVVQAATLTPLASAAPEKWSAINPSPDVVAASKSRCTKELRLDAPLACGKRRHRTLREERGPGCGAKDLPMNEIKGVSKPRARMENSAAATSIIIRRWGGGQRQVEEPRAVSMEVFNFDGAGGEAEGKVYAKLRLTLLADFPAGGTWHISRKAANKAMHAYYGNTTATPIPSRRTGELDAASQQLLGLPRGTFPNPTGRTCHLASAVHSIFASTVLLERITNHEPQEEHESMEQCGMCLLRDTEAASRSCASRTLLFPMWVRWLEENVGASQRMQDAAEDAFHLLSCGPCRLYTHAGVFATVRTWSKTVPGCSCGETYNRSKENGEMVVSVDVPEAHADMALSEVLAGAAEWRDIDGHCEHCQTPADRQQKMAITKVGDVLFLALNRAKRTAWGIQSSLCRRGRHPSGHAELHSRRMAWHALHMHGEWRLGGLRAHLPRPHHELRGPTRSPNILPPHCHRKRRRAPPRQLHYSTGSASSRGKSESKGQIRRFADSR